MKQPIRVLHVFHGMDCGGAENMIMNLYRNIDRDEVQFDFLVHTKKKCYFDAEIKSLGGRIFHVPYYNVVNHYSYDRILRNFFKRHPEIRIVHGHLGSCAHIYLEAANSFGCFTIAHSHSTLPTDISIKNYLYRAFNLKTRRIADYYMACGKQAGIDRFGKRIVDSGRFCVVNNAIDSKKYIYNEAVRNRVRKELDISDAFVVGHIGRFNYPKNHDFLIDVFYELQKSRTNVKLLLVGDGDLREKIELKSEKLGIKDKVLFVGIRSDVPELLQAMDCFVFPSHYEGLGIVAVEAQAAGIPTICSDVVPKEAAVTDLIRKLSLNDAKAIWVKNILAAEHTERVNTYEQICAAKYDIGQSVKEISEFYKRVRK